MKSYRPDVKPDLLLQVLCKFFKIEYDDVTYLEKIEMFYIYHYLVDKFKTTDPDIIFGEIKKLQAGYKMRSKRKKLQKVYFTCKITTMSSSGRYDTTTIKIPVKPVRERYY